MGTVPKNTPMSSAPFVYNENGEVQWDKMWDQFCMLAREGGPPHRGDLLTKKNPTDTASESYKKAVAEVLRAYKLLTNYTAWEANGWITIKLYSNNMAKWFVDTITMENVECHRDGRLLFIPINDDFTLEKEIKNVVTVVAKATHYWTLHRNWFTKLVIHLTGKDIQSIEE